MKDDFKMESDFKKDCIKWHSRLLTGTYAHWCWDWDFMPIDETCPEFESCTCYIVE